MDGNILDEVNHLWIVWRDFSDEFVDRVNNIPSFLNRIYGYSNLIITHSLSIRIIVNPIK